MADEEAAEPEASAEAPAERPSYAFEDLAKMTVAQLREICEGWPEQDAVQGYTQLNKEHLIPLLCGAMGIEAHAHHVAVGIDKGTIKSEIRARKAERDRALQSGDRAGHRRAQRDIHDLKRKLRRAIV